MPEQAGMVNAYICEKCGKPTVTINAETGTTPFLIKCKRIECQEGMARSSFYRNSQEIRPTFEWFHPDEAQIAEHVDWQIKANPQLAEERESLIDQTRRYCAGGAMLMRRASHETLELFGFRTRHG